MSWSCSWQCRSCAGAGFWKGPRPCGPKGQPAPPRDESADWLEHTTEPWLAVWIEPRLLATQGLPRQVTADPIPLDRPSLAAQVLVQYATEAPAQQLAPRRKSGDRLYFNLREAGDSVAQRDRERIAVELELGHPWLPEKQLRLPVLVLQSELAQGELHVEECLVDATWLIQATWTATRRFVNRQLRLWSLSRPWDPPHEHIIADDAAASCELLLPLALLPPGAYRVELAVVDPWSAVLPQLPGRRAPGKADVLLGERAERRRHLETTADDARGALERALSAETVAELNQAQAALVRCFAPSAAPDYLVVLWLLTESYGEADAPATATGLMPSLGRLLQLVPPVQLLAETARLAAPMTALQRADWADAVQSISGSAAHLLRLLHREGGLYLDDLAHWLQLDRLTASARAAALGQLAAAGIQLRTPSDPVLTEDSAPDAEPALAAALERRRRDRGEKIPELLQIYMRQIGRIPLLNPTQERQLASLIREGLAADARLHNKKKPVGGTLADSLAEQAVAGRQALQSLATANLRFVVRTAQKFLNRGLAPEDLIQEGSIGVLTAAGRFDGRRGVRFLTYAHWWIKQTMRRAIQNQARSVRIPVHRIQMLQRLRLARSEFWRELHREPSTAELAEALGLTEKVITQLTMSNWQPIGLDAEIEGADGMTLAEALPDPQAPNAEAEHAAAEMKTQLTKILDELKPGERKILDLRYGLHNGNPLSVEEIAQLYGVTRQRISQILDKTLTRLQHPKRAARLKDLL